MTATATISHANVHENADSPADTVAKASLIAMSTFSGLVGLWAASCFISALLSNGPADLLKGLFTALT